MKPVLRFDRPRFVAASGNGALVIRGRCAEEAPAEEADARWYCVRSPAGKMREVRVKGFDLGVERVVGLGDGRVAVLVPPRGGSPGIISLISGPGGGAAPANVPLVLPAEPKNAARELRHGMWLEGFEEREPGVLGGWVEAGGPVVGVVVTLDGKVKAGEVRDDPAGETGGVIVGGRFAVSVIDGGRAAETSDGGMTWSTFDLPARDDEARAVPSRAVGPVGAALPGWVRVGWGETGAADDMKPAASPTAPYVPLKVSPSIGLRCELATVASPPPGDRPRAAPPPPPPPPPRGILARRGFPAYRPPVERGPGWLPFRNMPPPPLAADEVGIDNGAAYDAVQVRAYAWGKKGTDWTRTGRWLVRFDDRFDAAVGVQSSALTASPWPDEAAAREGMGTGGASYGNASWGALLDPSGRAALVSACHSAASCLLYAVGEGQPVLPVRDAAGRPGGFIRPYPGGAVRVGDTWYLLAQSASYDAVALYRVDLGVARQIGGYFRPVQRYGFEAPRLVRRALGGGIGVLVGGAPEPGERSARWYVLPADLETGELGEAIVLARRDLSVPSLPRCAAEQDGWVLDTTPETTTPVELDNARAQIDAVEMRVRIDPGAVCIERMASRGGPFYPPAGKGAGPTPKPLTAPPGRKGGIDDATAIPLAVTEKATGRRWGLACVLKGRK